MIVEMIALMLLLGSASGVMGTFLLWHHVGLRSLRRFVLGLQDQSSFRVLSIDVDDTTTPLRARFVDGVHELELALTQRGLKELWVVRARISPKTPIPCFEIAEERFARGTLSLCRRIGEPIIGRSAHVYRLYSDDNTSARSFLDDAYVRTGLTAVLSQQTALRSVVVSPSHVEVTFDRRGITRDEALAVIHATAQFADGVEDRAPQRRMLPPATPPLRTVHHTLSGMPLGVPVARIRRF